jgi:hypothetical protein
MVRSIVYNVDDRSQMTTIAYNEIFAKQNKTNSSSSKPKVFVQLLNYKQSV